MHRWIKHVRLAGTVATLFICSVVANASEIHLMNSTIFALDPVPVAKVKSIIEQPDPILQIDSESMIPLIYRDLSSTICNLITSETEKKSIENNLFLRNIAITHIDYQEIKSAVVVYGNINYLNQDF